MPTPTATFAPDADGDGIPDGEDNCPFDSNEGQGDGDLDGLGDACDPCPDDFDPEGEDLCTDVIYSVKEGLIDLGDPVYLKNVIVTATSFSAFFVTMDPGLPNYEGPNFASLYVYSPDLDAPMVGDRLNLEGRVNDYFDQTQLLADAFTVSESGVPVPAPIVINDPATLIPGGELSLELEGSLVRVDDVEVLDTSPSGADGENVRNEFQVTGGLSVDDQIYYVEPFPEEGQIIPSLTGVLRYSWERNKLLPRGVEDVDLGPLQVASVSESEVFLYAGSDTSEPPLVVSLSRPSEAPYFVSILSSDPDALTVQGGGVTIPAGQRSAEVRFVATEGEGSVTLTVDPGGLDAEVEVSLLIEGRIPGVSALEPALRAVPVGESLEYEITLDAPAPAGGQSVAVAISGAYLDGPASVFIPEGERSGGFILEAALAPGEVVLEASTANGAQFARLGVQVPLETGLVISEFFPNPAGDDEGQEWVALYNAGSEAISLGNWSLGYGGVTYDHGTFQLSGRLEAGFCVIVGGPLSTEANGFPTYFIDRDFEPNLQNGGITADAIALFPLPANEITAGSIPHDVLLYGEANVSEFRGRDTNIIATPDVIQPASGQSVQRTGVDTWELSDEPFPSLCGF